MTPPPARTRRPRHLRSFGRLRWARWMECKCNNSNCRCGRPQVAKRGHISFVGRAHVGGDPYERMGHGSVLALCHNWSRVLKVNLALYDRMKELSLEPVINYGTFVWGLGKNQLPKVHLLTPINRIARARSFRISFCGASKLSCSHMFPRL